MPFRILHNHVTIDAVATVLPFGTDRFWSVVGRLRRDLVAAAADEGIDLIYTYVFGRGEEQDVADLVAPYEEKRGAVWFIQLLAPRAVLLERVALESRQEHGKLTDPQTLERLLDQYDDFRPRAHADSLTIDLGTNSAADAANLIVEYIDDQAMKS